MCGRYQLDMSNPSIFKKRFKTRDAPDMESRYNIAPSQMLPVILPDNVLTSMVWGLIPFWERNNVKPRGLINMRDDTAVRKKWANRYLKLHRCIVPASGFYEWKRNGDRKTPYYIRLKDHDYFGFAGVYSWWEHPMTHKEIDTYAILTTFANSFMERIHARMPVILDEKEEQAWLNPDMTEINEIQQYMRPYPSDQMEAYSISTRVNSPTVDDKTLITPAHH